ncbi:MAG TPA: hypothetical protein EYH45_04965 [Candidatus Caldiarchaeum subterraneum]|uniref:Proteasome assembly chaperone family protein n=1 Tax=Caldiarchaeum subterraneum TaxID=311458 RepID=A0A833E9X9_CALS0|nr:hypothetical protein [Candidatus Caldarchaeum subterraneum]
MQLRSLEKPPEEVDILVAALPDMGNVAGIAMQHLVSTLNMVKFAELLAYWPPYIKHKDGSIIYSRSNFAFYKPTGERGFIVFSGEFQPHEAMFLYELCGDVIEYSLELGVKRVITLGAAHTDGEVREPRVFYAASSDGMQSLAEECGAVQLQGEGYITGFNGLLLGLAMEHNLEALCILGEIDKPEIRQPKAAKHVLACLAKILDIEDKMDYRKLDEEYESIRAKMVFAQEYRRLQRSLWRNPPGVV